MRKVLVDLDVVTMAKRDKGVKPDLARQFLSEVVEGAVQIQTPVVLLKRLLSWGHSPLVSETLTFYFDYSEQLLTDKQVKGRFEELGLNDDAVLDLLQAEGVKMEDAFLALVSSVFDLRLVTFNKRHLQNKKDAINDVFRKFGLASIEVSAPESELSEGKGGGYETLSASTSNLRFASLHSAVRSPLISSANTIGSTLLGIFVLPNAFSTFSVFKLALIILFQLPQLIYKPFHSFRYWIKGVFGKSLAA